jgi:hypothetical protein
MQVRPSPENSPMGRRIIRGKATLVTTTVLPVTMVLCRDLSYEAADVQASMSMLMVI